MTVPTNETFTIRNWRKYQRYTDRLPKWYVLTATLRDDLDYKAIKLGIPQVTDAEIGHLIGLFSLATKHDRPDEMPDGPEFPMNPLWIQKKAGLNSKPNLDRLVTLCVISCNNLSQDVTNTDDSVTHRTGQDRTEQDRTTEVVPRSSEADAGPQAIVDKIILQMPVKDGEIPVTESDIKELERLYGNIDVVAALKKMRGHWLSKPLSHRKTSRGIRTSINTWLGKDSDRASGSNIPIGKGQSLHDRNERALKEHLKWKD